MSTNYLQMLYICIMKLIKLYIAFLLTCLSLTNVSGKDSFWKNIDPTFDKLTERMELWARFQKDSFRTEETIKQMYAISQQKNNKQLFARSLYWDVYVQNEILQDSAFTLTEKALSLSDSIKYPYDHARINMQKAVVLSRSASYSEAFHLYSKSIEVFKQVGDHRLVANALSNIGYIFLFLGEYNDATTFFMQADSIYSNLGLNKEKYECQLLLANIYDNTNKTEKAYDLLRPIVEAFKPEDSPSIKISFLTAYLPCLKDTSSLRKYSDEAYELAKQIKSPYYLLITTLNKGWVMFNTGQKDSAYIYANQASAYAMDPVISPQEKEGVYKLFASVYAERQQWDSAYHYQNLYYTCKNSIRGKDVVANIHRMKIKKEIEEYRIQSTLEKQKAHQRSMYFLIIGITLVIMLVLSVYIICLLRKRMQIEHQKQIEKDREYITHLSKEKELVEIKNRELSSNAVLLMKKNKMLKDMLKDMESMRKNNQTTARELQQKILLELKEDDTWNAFKLHFDQVHPSFFSTLKERFPKLTDNDLRLCAYIRIGLNNKQIAQMLLVQSKAVIQARYRLKKKMDLTDEASISDYLESMLNSK